MKVRILLLFFFYLILPAIVVLYIQFQKPPDAFSIRAGDLLSAERFENATTWTTNEADSTTSFVCTGKGKTIQPFVIYDKSDLEKVQATGFQIWLEQDSVCLEDEYDTLTGKEVQKLNSILVEIDYRIVSCSADGIRIKNSETEQTAEAGSTGFCFDSRKHIYFRIKQNEHSSQTKH